MGIDLRDVKEEFYLKLKQLNMVRERERGGEREKEREREGERENTIL